MDESQTRARLFERMMAGVYSDEAAFTDLLTDALHDCHQRGVDFDDVLRVARGHFEVETSQRRAAPAPTPTEPPIKP